MTELRLSSRTCKLIWERPPVLVFSNINNSINRVWGKSETAFLVAFGQKSHPAMNSVSCLVLLCIMNFAEAVHAVCSHPGSDHFVIARVKLGVLRRILKYYHGDPEKQISYLHPESWGEGGKSRQEMLLSLLAILLLHLFDVLSFLPPIPPYSFFRNCKIILGPCQR